MFISVYCVFMSSTELHLSVVDGPERSKRKLRENDVIHAGQKGQQQKWAHAIVWRTPNFEAGFCHRKSPSLSQGCPWERGTQVSCVCYHACYASLTQVHMNTCYKKLETMGWPWSLAYTSTHPRWGAGGKDDPIIIEICIFCDRAVFVWIICFCQELCFLNS